MREGGVNFAGFDGKRLEEALELSGSDLRLLIAIFTRHFKKS